MVEPNTPSNPAQKTPISLLQELCAQQGITPDYKLISVEGAVHAPTFMYRVQIGEAVATGTGQSKKKAKHAAAKAILEQLLSSQGQFGEGFVSDGVTVNAESLDQITATPSQSATQEEGVPGNPVGALQEKCMKMRWQPPFYETEEEKGLPHERVFTIACYVDHLVEKGEGKSKRLAKRQAAHNMLKRLKDLEGKDEEETKNEAKVNGLLGTNDVSNVKEKHSNLQSAYSQKVMKFLKDLKTSKSLALMRLQEVDLMDPNLDCANLLQEISEELEFEITYIPMEAQGKNGDFHCMVQISSLPLAVCFGRGFSKEEAKTDAAFNALQFIKIMSKKQ